MERLEQIRSRLVDLEDPVALLEGIFAFAPVGFQIYDASGRSILVNAAFRALFGSEPPPDYNVLKDEIAERNGVLDLVKRAFTGEVVRIPPMWYDARELRRVVVKDGKRVAVDATFFPLLKEGRVSHVAIVFKDVTAEKSAQDALEATRQELKGRVAQRTTELASANAALAEMIRQLEEAQRLTGIGSWNWDITADTLSWSAELHRMFGVSPEALTPTYDAFLTFVHEEDRERARRSVEEALDRSGVLDYEYRIVRRDGEERHIHTRGSVVRDAAGRPVRMFGTAQDVTEQRRADEERAVLVREQVARSAAEAVSKRASFLAKAGVLLASSLDYEVTLRNVIALVLPTLGDFGFFDIVEPDGRVRRIAAAHDDPRRQGLLEHTSWVRSDRTDINLCALSSGHSAVHPHTDDVWLQNVAEGPEHLALMRDLAFRSMLTTPLLYEGRCLGALTLFRGTSSDAYTADDLALADELARRAAAALQNARLYADLKQSEARAQAAVERANDASRRKDEFLAMLGHDLRNPLSPILSAVQILQRKDPPAPREVAVIDRQVQHLKRLVDELLDGSRILHGKVELQKEPVRIIEVVLEALDTVRPLLEERSHHVSLDQAMNGPTVNGDRVRLVQTLTNLLTNAAKYTPPGGRIAIATELAGAEVILRIRDNGAGMPPELIANVFEPFVQGERSLDRSQGGLGLGLAVVRTMVERHGGTVAASSAGPGQGSTFTIRLPAIAPILTEARPASPLELHPDARRRPRRVLVVEDNLDAVEMLCEIVEMGGHEAHEATDGPSALALVDGGFEPEIAFLDIGLPGMDGYELARRLRKRCGEHLRLVAVSGYGQAADRARSHDAGFAQHLVKPVGIKEVLAALDELGDAGPGRL